MQKSRNQKTFSPTVDSDTNVGSNLDTLCSELSGCREKVPPPELVDGIAITVGEIIWLFTARSNDELARVTLAQVQWLCEVARTKQSQCGAMLVEAGMAQTQNVARIIREEKSAA